MSAEKDGVQRADPARWVALDAPAKINLGLRVLGRRADGYHLIESLFVPLDLADEVRVEAVPARSGPFGEAAGSGESGESGERVQICVEVAPDVEPGPLWSVPADGRNLAVRAAKAFLERARLGADFALRLRLVKRIPVAAGLGGGSSDAAAVLLALGRLFPGALPVSQRAELALSLGADVPFFLEPRPSFVCGIGERIEPVEGVPRLFLALANPGDSLATSDIYAAHDALSPSLTPVEPGYTMRAISGLVAADEEDDRAFSRRLEEVAKNDLEQAALRLCPPVGRIGRQLREAGALAVAMSGSGATIFGVFRSEAAARVGLDGLALGEGAWARLAVSRGSR